MKFSNHLSTRSIFLLFVFTVAVSLRAFFRMLAALFKAEAPAQALSGVLILALSLYTGYQIPRPSMIGALRWISYINVRLHIAFITARADIPLSLYDMHSRRSW